MTYQPDILASAQTGQVHVDDELVLHPKGLLIVLDLVHVWVSPLFFSFGRGWYTDYGHLANRMPASRDAANFFGVGVVEECLDELMSEEIDKRFVWCAPMTEVEAVELAHQYQIVAPVFGGCAVQIEPMLEAVNAEYHPQLPWWPAVAGNRIDRRNRLVEATPRDDTVHIAQDFHSFWSPSRTSRSLCLWSAASSSFYLMVRHTMRELIDYPFSSLVKCPLPLRKRLFQREFHTVL